MRKLTAVIALSVAAMLCQVAAAQDKKPDAEKKAAAPEQTYEWYKADYVVYEVENGKRSNARNYTMMLRDNNRDVQVKTGSRVPVTQGTGAAFQYLDVGVNIRSSMQQLENRLSLITNFDISSVAAEPTPAAGGIMLPPVIRQIQASNVVTQVTLAKPLLVSSLDDVLSKRRFEVEVTVTKQ